MKKLSDIKCGETIYVEKVIGNIKTKHRLMEMGIVKGTKILVKKFAPLNDPIEIKLRGYYLALRKSDAENILVI